MGFDWKRFGQLALQFAPQIAMVAGLPPVVGVAIGLGVGEAQKMSGATNEEKKAHVIAMANAAITGANAVLVQHGKPTVDSTLLLDATSKAIDTTVDVVKTVHANHPEQTVSPVTGAAVGQVS